MGLQLVTGPAIEPLSLAEVKEFLRLDDDDASQDNSIEALIRAGRERCERITRQALINQRWLLALDRFYGTNGVIELPIGPLNWQTDPLDPDTVKYIDVSTGTLTTLASTSYELDDTGVLPTIRPAYLAYWPSTQYRPQAVQIRFTVGYGTTADSVPMEIRERIKNYVAYCFEHRTDRDEGFLDSLFQGFWCGAY